MDDDAQTDRLERVIEVLRKNSTVINDAAKGEIVINFSGSKVSATVKVYVE